MSAVINVGIEDVKVLFDEINRGDLTEESIAQKVLKLTSSANKGEDRYWQTRLILRLLDIYPGRVDLIKNMARLQEEGNAFSSAADSLLKCEDVSQDLTALLRIFDMLERSHRYVEAEALLQSLKNDDQFQLDYQKKVSASYWRQEKLHEALQAYDRLHKIDATDYWAPIMVCYALFRLNRFEDLRAYVSLGDSSWTSNGEVKKLLDEAQSYTSAAFVAMKSSPDSIATHIAFMIQEGRVREAIQLGWDHYWLYMKGLGEIDIEVLYRLAELHPSVAPNLSFFMKRECARLFPDSVDAVRNFGKALFARYSFDDARRLLLGRDASQLSLLELVILGQLSIGPIKAGEISPKSLFEGLQRTRTDEVGTFFRIRNTVRNLILSERQDGDSEEQVHELTIPHPYNRHDGYTKLFDSILKSPPILLHKPRRLKIALCVSGQLRGFRAALPKTLRTFEDIGQVDTFVHTWAKIGISAGAHGWMDRILPPEITNTLPPELKNIDAFRQYFPIATDSLIGEQAEVSVDEIMDLTNARSAKTEPEDDFDAHTRLLGCEMINQRKMIYKIHACDELRRAYEIQQGFSYDLVVRVRPDLPVSRVNDGHLISLLDNQNTIGVSYLLKNGIGDQVAVGSARAMSAYASIWPFLKSEKSLDYLPSSHGLWAEQLFLLHLGGMGLDILPSPIVETEPLIGPASSRVVKFFHALCGDALHAELKPYTYDIIHETAAWIVQSGLATREESFNFLAVVPQGLGELYSAMAAQARLAGDISSAKNYENNAKLQRDEFMRSLEISII